MNGGQFSSIVFFYLPYKQCDMRPSGLHAEVVFLSDFVFLISLYDPIVRNWTQKPIKKIIKFTILKIFCGFIVFIK